MPRSRPTKQTITIRVDPMLVAEFRAVGGKNFSAAIDEGVRLWIDRERRWQKQGKSSTSRGAGWRPPKRVSARTAEREAFARAFLEAVHDR
jgi:hypothetical protein